MTDQPHYDEAEIRRRQKERARITAIGLFAFAALVFGITIAKLGIWG